MTDTTKHTKPQHKEGCSVYWVSNSGYPFQCNCGAEVQEPATPSPDPEMLKAARARIEQMVCSSGADLEHLPNPSLCLSDRCDKCNLLRFLDAFAQSCTERLQEQLQEKERELAEALAELQWYIEQDAGESL